MSKWVTLKAEDGHELQGYVARPQGQARGGLVVVQEIFGVNSHIQAVADSYAAEGYVAIAPALFDRYERGLQLNYDADGMKRAFELYGQLKPETALLDVAAAFAHVKAEGHGAGVMGFCYGGLMSWLSATRGEDLKMQPDCTIGYYAGGVGHFATEQPSCPVMLHFGAEDSHIGQDQIDAVRHAHPEVLVYVYEGAGHGFNRQPDPNSYRADAAQLARQRTLEFLKENIG